MSRIILVSHKRTVGSGSELAKKMGAICITPKFPPKGGFRDGDTLINWGVGSIPNFAPKTLNKKITLVNPFLKVRRAVNKLRTLSTLQDQDIPSLRPITSKDTALQTLHASREGTKMFARELLCGSQGNGIQVFDSVDAMMVSDLTKYKMFTLGFKKNREFRVHVVNGKVIDYAQKRSMKKEKLLANNLSEVDRDIRSHKRGWVFAKVQVDDFPEVHKLAIDAVAALELSFGAVDILARCSKNKLVECVVCEVNTAPSLAAESTMNAYIEAFSTK